MNIVNKVTIRHLKENKRRTLVTIFGVIISVAMITAVAALGMSFIDMQQRDVISDQGDWHYSMAGPLDQDQLEAIQSDDNTDTIGLTNEIGYAPPNEDAMQSYIHVSAMNEAAMEQMQVKVMDGRLPTNENEVVMSEALEGQYQIGDTIELELGERYALDEERYGGQSLTQDHSLQMEDDEVAEELRNQQAQTYTIVGEIKEPFWDRPWSPGVSLVSYTDDQSLAAVDTATIKVKNVKQSIFEDAEALANANDLTAGFNTPLLDAHLVSLNAGMVAFLTGVITMIMIIVMVGAVALIYNAFAISVSERSRYLGMLSSIGATKSQKRNSVLFEGVIIAVISIPIGIAAGLLGIGITIHYVSPMLEASGMEEGLRLVVTLPSMAIAVVLSFLTIMISAFIPALRASRITAIDAIRQAKDVKLTKKKIKTNRLVQKLFGYEADIALKNLKRNKKRYQITVFSLMISIILFLSVGFFTNTLLKSFELQSDQQNYDISIRSQSTETGTLQQLKDDLADIDDVTDSVMYNQRYVQVRLPESIAGDTMGEDWANEISEDGYPYMIQMIGMEASDWKNYLNEHDIPNPADGEIEGVLVNTVTFMNSDNKYEETAMLDVEVGDQLPLQVEQYQEDTEAFEVHHAGDVGLISLTDEFPMGDFYPSPNTLFLLFDQSTLEQLDESLADDRDLETQIYLSSDDPEQTVTDIESLEGGNEVDITNLYQYQQQDQQLALALSVFIYGFITLITLISIANIFNTISTSVALRKREFATMKSIGMTPKAFRKMIRFESIFYGVKSLLYGLPVSVAIMYLIHMQTQNAYDYGFRLPWLYIGIVILAVFLIVAAAMLYSISKIKDDNVIETLRQENI
ncbi:ABC transporter permease [Gracilibacillus timonensis]|uniref:ABC transporter permease n=1 Tax=Gracilibacillus timonensis TaxID=1816696 RepID=UPI000824B0F5|nr:FtsX-like permease family protein [Gracilibacillus timonensis]